MSTVEIAIALDGSALAADMQRLTSFLESLPEEVRGDFGCEFLRALESGVIDVVLADDAPTVGARGLSFRFGLAGLDEFLAAAARARKVEFDGFHGDPSGGGFDGRGDRDSTAGADSHPFPK